jgi:hypothetical protein
LTRTSAVLEVSISVLFYHKLSNSASSFLHDIEIKNNVECIV